MHRRTLLALATLALTGLASATAAVAGPPWISIELPANPLDPSTRGAYLLVHTFHHEQVTRELVSGTAEGMVRGQRRTIELEFDRTSRPGVLALKRQWPAEGTWVLALRVGRGEGSATALVGIAANGEVRFVRVPTNPSADGRFWWPKPVTTADVERELRALGD